MSIRSKETLCMLPVGKYFSEFILKDSVKYYLSLERGACTSRPKSSEDRGSASSPHTDGNSHQCDTKCTLDHFA